jgi:hypothetical protein
MKLNALQRTACVAAFAMVVATCADDTPAGPLSPTVNRIDVGVLGGAPARVSPQQTLQLWAIATGSDGATTDVTNLAAWSSSNGDVATVAPGGVVSARSPGATIIRAQYGSAAGVLETAVAIMPCAASTLSPPALVFAAKPAISCSDYTGYGQRLDVAASSSSCRWTAVSDAPWLSLACYDRVQSYTPPTAGSGTVRYNVLDHNNTTSARIGNITVLFDDGSRLVHRVTVEAPACSYTTSPLETRVPREGGEGSFEVVAVPAGCAWKLPPAVYGGGQPDLVPSITSGVGTLRVNYRVANLRDGRTFTITVTGPNSADPIGVHTVLQGFPNPR